MVSQGSSVDTETSVAQLSVLTTRLVAGMSVPVATIMPSSVAPHAIPVANTSAVQVREWDGLHRAESERVN